MAGLAAARVIHEAGLSAVVLESSDGVGGRVRTDEVDGFLLDRGFQVLLTAYPELHRQFDVSALDLRAFDPGALVWRNGRGYEVSDPFRKPTSLVSTALAPVGSPFDKARIELDAADEGSEEALDHRGRESGRLEERARGHVVAAE
jgi:phytoene dehydrogenase-like protein